MGDASAQVSGATEFSIGKQVQGTIEDMEEISRAFIHIDPQEV